MEPIRILHVLGRLNRGGAETLVMNWYRAIDKEIVQFDFVIHTTEKCSYTDEILSMGGRIYSVPRYCGKNHMEYCREWNSFFDQHNEYKVIHGHVRSTAAIYLAIAKKRGLTTISHSHAINSGSGISGVVKKLLQYPIRYIADHRWSCSEVAGKFLFGNKFDFKVMKNAIKLSDFSYNLEVRELIRKELKISEKFVIGHVGRFVYEKNHGFLLDVFEKYYKKNDNAVLLLIGVGPLKHDIEEMVKQRGLEEAVKFLGECSNVSDIMQGIDVFAFPSVYEGLGIVAIEAQAAGLPVLISDRVPNEVEVTKLVSFLPVNTEASEDKWIQELDRLSTLNLVREKQDVLIYNAGYDIVNETKYLMNEYLNMVSNR